MQKLGIIGAGQMGNGIAQVAATSGYDVMLCDVSLAQAQAAQDSIGANMDRLVRKEKLPLEESQIARARITITDQISALHDCDMVIEAATENEKVKTDIFRTLCETLKPDALIASNTSSISITRLAASTNRPDKFMGVHFMNPVPVMQLVELIQGIATSEETYNSFEIFAHRLGKTIAVSEDFPAFIVNRILIPMINEAIYTLYEGVGNVEAIDTAMKLGANHPMGPLALADFIGLDTCLAIMQVLYDGLADSKYRPCPLLVKYVEAGWLGLKSKRGFYDYNSEIPVPTR